MRINVDTRELDAFAADLKGAAAGAKIVMGAVVRDTARLGNTRAKNIARKTAGRHGRRYPNSFYAVKITDLEYEYGPTAGKKQGGMSFEFGSRNQPPHLDLAASADLIEMDFAEKVGAKLGAYLDEVLG